MIFARGRLPLANYRTKRQGIAISAGALRAHHVSWSPHYITAAGLVGIANTGTLWTTNFRSVENRSEMLYALKILTHATLEYVVSQVPSDFLRDSVEPSTTPAQ